MEDEKKINWLSLFIKIVIAFAFILIIVWLVSKLINRNKLSDTFKNNINNMETVAVKYFKDIDLPTKQGESIKVTLGEMIEKELIVSVKTSEGGKCDTKDSYSKITRKKDNYEVETRLECGKEENTITRKFSFNDCKNCTTDTKNNNTKNNDTKNNNTDGNNSTNNSNKSTGVTYYEYVKEWTTYTKWMKGNKTGDNIENKYKYYATAEKTYYSLGIINKKDIKDNTIEYRLKLNDVPNSKYYFTTIKESSYYNDEKEFASDKSISVVKDSSLTIDNIKEYSLKENNFTYKLTPYYYKGTFYINVKVNIRSLEGIKNIKDKYLVPIKITIKFNSGDIVTTKSEGSYDTITYYRYIQKNRDVIWSADNYVEGYTKTGNTKVQ
jgi:hypothetical protein